MSTKFKREERYIVVKLKHLAGLQVAPLRNFLRENRVPTIDCVVVEADWPEYEPVWQMIERRMTGQPQVTAAEELDAVVYWRSKYGKALKVRDQLQRDLTAADGRSVSREAVEKALLAMKRIYQAGYDRIIDAGGTCDTPEYMMANDPTARELRALLDEPACRTCDDKGAVGNILNAEPCPDCAPAAQPQGEPIYQLEYLGEGGGGWNDVDKATYDRFEHLPNYRPRIVYAEQLAPASPQAAQPVAVYRFRNGNPEHLVSWNALPDGDHALYTHADAGEVEELKSMLGAEICKANTMERLASIRAEELDTLRAQLAEMLTLTFNMLGASGTKRRHHAAILEAVAHARQATLTASSEPEVKP